MSTTSLRWLFYGELLEDHVCQSLADSLESMGQIIYRLESVYKQKYMFYDKGFKTINRDGLYNVCKYIYQFINKYKIDVFFNYRFFEVPDLILEIMRRRGIKLITWFGDDPLLYNLTKQCADSYDITLHTGSDDVLKFYDDQCSKKVVRYLFPFWTSQKYFPYIYNPSDAEFDIGFLGNMDSVKRKGKRYDFIADLPFKRVVWGKVKNDYASICGGYIDDFYDIPNYLKKLKIGINFSQDFTELSETDGILYFDGVQKFVEFYIPSRIVQYLSCGIPVINISKIDTKIPSIYHATTIEQVINICNSLLQNNDHLQRASMDSFHTYNNLFSSDNRAKMLLRIVQLQGEQPFNFRANLWRTIQNIYPEST